MNRITRAGGVLAVSLLLAQAPAASAAAPPKGDYGCTYTTFSGTFYAGTLNILGKSRYSVNDKKKGRYSSRGRKILFKTGDYRTLYFGRWSKERSVLNGQTLYLIRLYGKRDRKAKLSCTRS